MRQVKILLIMFVAALSLFVVAEMPGNAAESVPQLLQQAGQGDANAQLGLGWMYFTGSGVAQDDHAAVFWYQQAADQGNAEAQFRLGAMYATGRGVAQNMVEANKWWRLAAAQGNEKAQEILRRAREYDHGSWIELYMKGVMMSLIITFPFIVFVIARAILRKLLTFRLNPKEVRQEAAQRNAEAQFNLGMKYCQGNGVVQDDHQAVAWFQKAADQGYALAQFNLGWMYQTGRGVHQNMEEAKKWWRLAAVQGNENAQEALRRAGETW